MPSRLGQRLLCLDIDPKKIELLNGGGVPIHEPGLHEVIKRNVESGRLRFTTDVADSVAHVLVQMIAVGTPSDEDGSDVSPTACRRSKATTAGHHAGEIPVGL